MEIWVTSVANHKDGSIDHGRGDRDTHSDTCLKV